MNSSVYQFLFGAKASRCTNACSSRVLFWSGLDSVAELLPPTFLLTCNPFGDIPNRITYPSIFCSMNLVFSSCSTTHSEPTYVVIRNQTNQTIDRKREYFTMANANEGSLCFGTIPAKLGEIKMHPQGYQTSMQHKMSNTLNPATHFRYAHYNVSRLRFLVHNFRGRRPVFRSPFRSTNLRRWRSSQQFLSGHPH